MDHAGLAADQSVRCGLSHSQPGAACSPISVRQGV